MANLTRIPVGRIFSFWSRSFSSPIKNPFFSSTLSHVPSYKISTTAHYSSPPPSPPPPLSAAMNTQVFSSSSRWRPMCLYFTQGKCTQMDDPSHLEKFNHDCSRDLQVNGTDIEKKRSQNWFNLDETEPLIRKLKHCTVCEATKIVSNQVWHDTAQPFKEVMQQFEAWLSQHNLWEKERGGRLTRGAFVTCGNWDLKTKIPQQCEVSGIKLPPYFMEWINLKDVYLNFYGRERNDVNDETTRNPIVGCHHIGIDDSKNIARVLQRMLVDGALMQVTAKRNPVSQKVEFLFENRIQHPSRQRQ
ncbi:hypothetical protein ERO13_A01G060932v2 [Gossypium hirsutum]|nr:hypothetical protein ERO13_A01G060932v2 [Gossypium hirsutum]